MAGSEPTSRGRLSVGKAVGQGWALWLAGFLSLAGGVSLLVNPGADLRLIRWLLGLFLTGWGVLRLVHVARAFGHDRTSLVLSGVTAVVAGIVVLAWPALTVTVLISLLVASGLALAAVDLVGASGIGGGTPSAGGTCSAAWGPCWLSPCCWSGRRRSLNVVRVLAAVLLILWGTATLGEAYQSPIRDNVYRRELDRDVRRII